MIIKLIATKPIELPRNKYIVSTHTMQGDADDSHSFELSFKNDDKGKADLREVVILAQRCAKRYPSGKRGYKGYNQIPGFEKWFEEHWYNYEGVVDSFQGYSVKFFDDDGKEFDCQIELDEEMEKLIYNYEDVDDYESDEYLEDENQDAY